ncbi:MAG TPA: 4Fe-4S binding protein [Planctomycetota bacterium]
MRWILRFTALAAAIILAWPLFRADATLAYFPALSPFIGILSAIALRSAGVLTLLCLPALILALLTPRGFCRYACPTGLLQDLCGKLRPAAAQKWRPLPPLGHWALLLTIGGACLGYPFLLWLDPLAVFAAFVSALHQPLSGILVSAGLLLPLIVLLAIILPNAWCMRICPLGAAQELLALLRKPNPPPSRTDAGDALSGSPLPPEGEGLG